MDLDSALAGAEDRADTRQAWGFKMRTVGLLLGAAILVTACSPTIDKARAGQIARDYFAGAHGTGITLSDVRETDLGITGDTACGAAWEVLMEGTVTESTGVSYGSHMYLCVDPTSGTVTPGPQG